MDRNTLNAINAQQEADQAHRSRESAERDAYLAKKRKAYQEAYPEESAAAGFWWFIGIVVVGLVLAWAHYGPIVRDAIYGVGG